MLAYMWFQLAVSNGHFSAVAGAQALFEDLTLDKQWRQSVNSSNDAPASVILSLTIRATELLKKTSIIEG